MAMAILTRQRASHTSFYPQYSGQEAFVLHADGRTAGGREGFLTWLKAIFNKSAEDRRSHIVDRAAVATQLDHPEIAVPKRPAGSLRKVDVVNQAPVNFGAARSTATLEDDDRFRVAEHHAATENGIEMINCCSPRRRVAAERENISGRDANPDSSWFDEVRRSEEKVGDVAEHPRSYTSPRHCYRVPPRQPLLGSFILNRSVPIRAIAAFGSGNSRPPIREPNVTPEKREKKDEKQNPQEKKKKPVIRTDDGSADSSESRAAIVADDNPTDDPETAFRYEWGVKLAEGLKIHPAEPDDSDKVAEKNQQYVTKRLWGVNLRQPSTGAEDATATTLYEVPERDAGKQIPNENSSTPDGKSDETRNDKALMGDAEPVAASGLKDLKDTTVECLSIPSNRSDSIPASGADTSIASRREADNASSSSDGLRKLQKIISPSTETIDEDYNVPADADLDTEIVAWKNLVIRSRTIEVPEKENFLSADHVENLQMVSIRPEAPKPKLDVQVVRSIEDSSKDEDADQPDSESVRPAEFKRPKSADARKFDNYSPSCKKLHTASWQSSLRYAHRDTRSVIQRCSESLSIDSAPVNAMISTSAAFSTESEDSFAKKTTHEASSEQTAGRQADAKRQEPKGEGECNDCNASNSLSTQRSVSSAESQTLLNNSKEADVNLIKTLNIISQDAETMISPDQSLIRDADLSKIAQPSTSASLKLAKDESHLEDENVQCETECSKNYKDMLHDEATYIDSNILSTGNGGQLDTMTDSQAAKKIPREIPSEDDHYSNVDSTKEQSDDSSREYTVDGNYVRLPGDPYPYSKEHLDKWRVSYSKNFSYKPIERATGHSDSPMLKNSSEASAVGEPRDSHSNGTIATETSPSGFDNCLQEDAVDALQRWSETFSRLDGGDGKANEAARVGDDNASLRAQRR